MRALPAFLSLCLIAGPALANAPAPPEIMRASAVEALLQGGWRSAPAGQTPPPCDQIVDADSHVVIFEMGYTGGRMTWTTKDREKRFDTARLVPGEDFDHAVLVNETGALVLSFEMADQYEDSGALMIVDDAAPFAAELKGRILRKCYAAADDDRVYLDRYDNKRPRLGMEPIVFFSQGGRWPPPRFVDMRYAKPGEDVCRAVESEYLIFDLVGPLEFTAWRGVSWGLAERMAAGQTLPVAPDEVTSWIVERARTADEGGWTFTLTELIPPNGSRGDTATITLVANGDILSIPEWKRDFLRCTTGEETTEVPE